MSSNFGFEAVTDPGYYFISYNTEDLDRVSTICNYLYKFGIPIWYDYGIPHDSNWEGVLAERIDHCQEAIFFITKGIFDKAQDRDLGHVYPYKEYDLAKRYQKKTLIVLLDNIDNRIVPYWLMGWWQEIDPSVKQGVLGIDTDLNEVSRRIIHELGFKEAYSINDDIKKPTFNSVIDHPVLGDERQFVYIRQGGEKEWHRSMKLVSGKQYEIKVNFRNDADPKYNYSSFNRQGIAVHVKMSIDVPSYISATDHSRIKVRITWKNDCYCEDSVIIESDDNKSKKIEYVIGQEKIHSKWKTDNSVLPSTLFSFDGTFIGLTSLNGAIPGGDEYSGYVNFYIDVDKEERAKQVIETIKSGWGPERKMFTMNMPATYPAINSISDNPTIGDERDFLRLGEICTDVTKLSGNTSSDYLIQPNKRYLVSTYCHNACSSTFFDEKHDFSGAATGIRLSCFYSEKITPSSKLESLSSTKV